MKKTLILLSAMFALSISTISAQELGAQRFIKVESQAEIKVVPNRIEININLSEKAVDGKIAMSEMENRFAKSLSEAGVDAKESVKLVLQSQEVKNKKTSYAYKLYKVTLDNSADVVTLFKTFNSNGILDASLGRTWHSQTDSLEREVQIKAVQQARTKAEILAQAAGVSTGQVLQIVDGRTDIYGGMARANIKIKGAPSALSAEQDMLPEIEVEDIVIRQYISVWYALED